ncbi:MAG TPA: hypothetical protein VMC04_05910 [Verrucomicrobiae bacterium]|nr:hypothetical protein [Verrucomicrobiae bacterium]
MSVYDSISGHFRRRRNRALQSGLERIHQALVRPVRVLDVGGTQVFWETIGLPSFVDVTVVNVEEAFRKPYWFPERPSRIAREIGSALDLGRWRGGLVDVVISNSVIEHVGGWAEITRAAAELRGAAPHGWVQTPAFSFPIEPHFALPFVHWLPAPVAARVISCLPHHGASGRYDVGRARRAIEENNLLTARELHFLFPDATIERERLLGMAKSLIATWGDMTRPG